MKTITKTYNIYKFEELPKVIQEKLIQDEEENIRQADVEWFLADEMGERAIHLLKENFGERAVFKKFIIVCVIVKVTEL